MRYMTKGQGPHAGQPIAAAGTPLGDATGALILAHGRGGNADEMLTLARLVAPPPLSVSRHRRREAPGIPLAGRPGEATPALAIEAAELNPV